MAENNNFVDMPELESVPIASGVDNSDQTFLREKISIVLNPASEESRIRKYCFRTVKVQRKQTN